MTRRGFLLQCVAALAAVFSAGCATNREMWDSRVGTYTYDDAVVEMGPPDREATTGNGQIICEWRTGKGGAHGTGFGMNDYYIGGGMGSYTVVEELDFYIRLTFSPDKVLQEWRKVRR